MSAVTDWMSTILLHMVWPSANLECRSEMFCTRFAANAGPKKSPVIRNLGAIAQICRAISSQLRHVSTIGKKLVKQQYLPYMSPQYGELKGPLAAEIVSLVWGTPGNFDGFRVLAALRHANYSSMTARPSSSGRLPNCGVEQRAPPIFGRAATTLGIGPHF